MEMDMLHAAGQALVIILDPHRLIYLFAGVCMGLGLGLLPGIGGIAGTAMLLPFTYDLDPHAAFALLLGLGATTTTADPISAILFGVPGHAARHGWQAVLGPDHAGLVAELHPDEMLVAVTGKGCGRHTRANYLTDPDFAGRFDDNQRFLGL